MLRICRTRIRISREIHRVLLMNIQDNGSSDEGGDNEE
jgi:hypothetical protein